MEGASGHPALHSGTPRTHPAALSERATMVFRPRGGAQGAVGHRGRTPATRRTRCWAARRPWLLARPKRSAAPHLPSEKSNRGAHADEF